LASYPIYWALSGDGLVFGGSLAAVLRYPGVPKALDPGTVADYVTFGHPLGTKTLAANVSLVPPGATLVFDWDAGAPVTTRYTNIADSFQPWTGARQEYLEALVDAFRRSIARAMSGTSPIGLSLSGGLDSRAILSAVNGRTDTLETYTLGVKGCADEVIAEGLSAIAHTHHTFFE